MLPVALALLATVFLLISMGFFALGSLPLLVLKHDTPLDARFIRGLFAVYYAAVKVTGAAAAIAYAFAQKPDFALGMAGVVALAFTLRRTIVTRMDQLRATMTATDAAGITRFRRLHIGGMLFNVIQLGTVAWGLTYLKL